MAGKGGASPDLQFDQERYESVVGAHLADGLCASEKEMCGRLCRRTAPMASKTGAYRKGTVDREKGKKARMPEE